MVLVSVSAGKDMDLDHMSHGLFRVMSNTKAYISVRLCSATTSAALIHGKSDVDYGLFCTNGGILCTLDHFCNSEHQDKTEAGTALTVIPFHDF